MLSSLFTIVFFLDILVAPLAKLDDKITGKRSGVIPMAIATANVKAVIVPCFAAFAINVIGINTAIKRINSLLTLSIPFWKDVLGFSSVIVSAILPKYVPSPTLITIPCAAPLSTSVPIKQIVSKSVISSTFPFCSDSASFFTESLSPVNEDWFTYKSIASIIRKSAGIKSPAFNKTTSPTVTSEDGIFASLPFLITSVLAETRFFNFSAALFERNTSINSSKVLAIIKIRITIIFA